MGVARSALLSVHEALPDYPVWPDNWDAVQLFMSAATQWRLDAMGRQAGLDYGALQLPMQHLRLRGRRARLAFAGLQTLEAAYLKGCRSRRRPQ
jgi:hypothetical protein